MKRLLLFIGLAVVVMCSFTPAPSASKYFRIVEMKGCYATPQARANAVNAFKTHYLIGYYSVDDEWSQGSAGVITEYCAHVRGVEFVVP